VSFWDLSDGEAANKDAKTEYEIPGGNMEPIPNDSDVLARIKDVKWAGKRDALEKYVEIQWQVEAPDQFKNRIVFHKLWVADLDPSAKDEAKAREKRDKARRMLATIDANAKGSLMQSNDAPTDNSLALALVDARMVIKVMEWSIEDSSGGGTIRGNWVAGVKRKDSETRVGNALPQKPSAPAYGGGSTDDLEDEIPF
jgi:hypothetical protein